MVTFEDHRRYTDPPRANVLDELRRLVLALDGRGRSVERCTPAQRIVYEICGYQSFIEVKVARSSITVRLLDGRRPDPAGITTPIPSTNNWSYKRNIKISTLAQLEAAMPFITASYHRSN